MRLKNVFGILLSLCTLVIVGCGGGGSDAPAPSSTISGSAVKGPIGGGTVTFFQINTNGTQGTQIPTTSAAVTTKSSGPSFGNYSATIAFAGPVLVKVTGGSYTDEVSGNLVNMGTNSLTAAIPNASGATRAAVTPFTDIAAKKLTSNTAASITAANTNVATAFGLSGVDIITASPTADPKYKFGLAVISQAAGPNADALATLLTTVANGFDVATGAITDPNVSTTIATATAAAFANPNVNPPPPAVPVVDGTAVSGVTITAPAAVQAINTQVAITATVKRVDGQPSVGTTVNFTVTSGSGTFTPASATTDSVGVATVSLASTAEGTVGFTASVGTLISASSVAFTDPNKPATITVNASATTVGLGTQVAISAVVTRAAGGPVPDNTTVAFAITTGTGTLSAAIATTTGGTGTATVNLTKNAVGAVVVTATAGAVSNTSPSVSFIAQVTKAVLKLKTVGNLAGALIGAWDTDIQFPASVTIQTAPGSNALAASAFALSGTNAAVGGSPTASSNPADGTHALPFVIAGFIANSGTGINVLGEVATITFDLVTPTATPTLTKADFTLSNTNVNSSAAGAPPLPGVGLDFDLSFQ